MLLNAHLMNSGNVGDEYCSPSHYFDGIERIHVTDPKLAGETIIYGGGAIAAGAATHSQKDTQAVLWGVGATQRHKKSYPLHPMYPESVKLFGIRDYQLNNKPKGYEWVPCVSCMHPAFDKEYEIEREFGYYGHAKMSPLYDLNNDEMDFEKVIQFLGSSEVVITSSYHGVYWATLLKKKVLCLPFGTKFMGFKHKPILINHINELSPSLVKQAVIYEEALQECRTVNEQFYEKVRDYSNRA